MKHLIEYEPRERDPMGVAEWVVVALVLIAFAGICLLSFGGMILRLMG